MANARIVFENGQHITIVHDSNGDFVKRIPTPRSQIRPPRTSMLYKPGPPPTPKIKREYVNNIINGRKSRVA
jgi:hypothetical protein